VDREFFATSAQVLAILMLAGLVEHRTKVDDDDVRHGTPYRQKRPERIAVLIRVFMMLGVAFGLVAAMTALAGRPTQTERRYVIVGLCVAGVSVAERFLDREIDLLIEATPGRRHLRVALIVVYALALFACVMVPLVAATW